LRFICDTPIGNGVRFLCGRELPDCGAKTGVALDEYAKARQSNPINMLA
jgi:hypothetical protein